MLNESTKDVWLLNFSVHCLHAILMRCGSCVSFQFFCVYNVVLLVGLNLFIAYRRYVAELL
jgi:hypothetical protein